MCRKNLIKDPFTGMRPVPITSSKNIYGEEDISFKNLGKFKVCIF